MEVSVRSKRSDSIKKREKLLRGVIRAYWRTYVRVRSPKFLGSMDFHFRLVMDAPLARTLSARGSSALTSSYPTSPSGMIVLLKKKNSKLKYLSFPAVPADAYTYHICDPWYMHDMRVNQSKLRDCNRPWLVFNNTMDYIKI